MTVTDLSPFPVVLASSSPRRSELLTAARILHVVRPSDIDESLLAGENPIEYVRRIAREKNLARRGDATEVVIAADTTVVVDDQILLKPADEDDVRFRGLLRAMSSGSRGVTRMLSGCRWRWCGGNLETFFLEHLHSLGELE
jgi:septum formation protein